jgi:hypothetical protein
MKESPYKEMISKPEFNFWVPIVTSLVGLAVSWGSLNVRMDHLEKMTLGLQTTYAEQRATNTTIQVQLAEIQKDILYIKKGLDEHLSVK